MFALGQILVCSLAGGVASLVVLAVWQRTAGRAAIALALIVAASIVLWRSAANTPALNDDPIPWVSPNDVLCPVVTYVTLGVYAGVARRAGAVSPAVRAALTAVSFAVNVLTI